MSEPSAEPTPLVHRAVRSGGLLIVIAALQFVVAMILVQWKYSGYSLSANYISDLGGSHSPWALLFDGSLIAMGALAVPALLLIWSSFDARPARSIGLLILMASAVGAICVGVFPETTHVLSGKAHEIASGITFLAGALGLIVLSFAMRLPERWAISGRYTLVSGAVSLAALVLYGLGYYLGHGAWFYLGLGHGGMERLVAAPLLLWMVIEGAHIGRLHRFAPGLLLPKSAKTMS
ncbi:MAG: DUF998 domain-containing protein [Thermoplasmata archaeon]